MKSMLYRVGYGRPPVSTRFQPGRSGNLNGRPKGTRNLRTELADELAETIEVKGSPAVTKLRAVVATLVRKAIEGDARAISTLVATCATLLPDDHGGEESLTAEDEELLQAHRPAGKEEPR
jgi:hypothetical protein